MADRQSGGFLVTVPEDLARFWRARVHRQAPRRARLVWKARLLVRLRELSELARDRPDELLDRLQGVQPAGGQLVRLQLWFNRRTYPRARRLVARIQAACGLPMVQVFWLALDGLRRTAGPEPSETPSAPEPRAFAASQVRDDVRGLVVALLTDEDEPPPADPSDG